MRNEAPIPESGIFTVTQKAGHVLISILGSAYKIQQLEELRREIEKALHSDLQSLAFGLQEAAYLNSSLINLLVMAVKILSAQKKPTYVITEKAEVLESLSSMDLDRVLKIVPNLEVYFRTIAEIQ